MVISMTIAIGNVTDAVLAEGGGSERVSAVAVNLGRDAAAEGERGEGVVVCEEDHGVDQLCEGPAVLLCLQKALEKKKKNTKINGECSQSVQVRPPPIISASYTRLLMSTSAPPTMPVISPRCAPWWEAKVCGQGFCWALRAAAASAGLRPSRSATWDHPRPGGSRSRAGWLNRNTGV